jgi:hypothetical protein
MSSIRRNNGCVKDCDCAPDLIGWKRSSPEFRRRLNRWITEYISPRKCAYLTSSYGLKHFFEQETNSYVTNDIFKAAMLEHGYTPVDARQLNWRFRIRFTGGPYIGARRAAPSTPFAGCHGHDTEAA